MKNLKKEKKLRPHANEKKDIKMKNGRPKRKKK